MMSKKPRPLVSIASDPDFSSVVLLLDFDGADEATAITDLSSSGHTISFVNSAQLDTAQMQFGTASLLTDVDTEDHLLADDSNDWYFAAGDFTVEADIRLATLPDTDTNVEFISHYEPNSGERSWTFGMENTSGQMRFLGLHNETGGGGAANQIDYADISVSINTWYHVAYCRNGADFRMFLDGVQQGSTFDWDTDSLHDSDHELTIMALGRGFPGPSNLVDGWIDNLRVTKGVARYTANFTPPTAAHPTS